MTGKIVMRPECECNKRAEGIQRLPPEGKYKERKRKIETFPLLLVGEEESGWRVL